MRPPPLRNDCFALPAGVAWTPVDEALERLASTLHPVVEGRAVALAEACGRILSEPCVARRANPASANAAVDGFGLSGTAVGEGAHILPLVEGRAAAGVPFEGEVPAGSALRILTGAALPEGVDTIVLQEDATTEPGRVAFHGPLKVGANTRRAGEDFSPDEVLLEVGQRLRPQDLALLAAAGVHRPCVFDRLKVAVISTGDELREVGTDARAHETYDANRPMLLSLLQSWGYETLDLGQVGDDRAALRHRLDAASTIADAVLTSGGASAGEEDHVSALLEETGSMSVWRIALKPGRPLALGLWRGTPVFGLPGNPVAAFVCALIFAEPALRRLSGGTWRRPMGFTVPAAFAKRKRAGRREYLRARLDASGAAEVFASEGSGRISGLSWSTGLVELPDEATDIAPGVPVRFLPYAAFGG